MHIHSMFTYDFCSLGIYFTSIWHEPHSSSLFWPCFSKYLSLVRASHVAHRRPTNSFSSMLRHFFGRSSCSLVTFHMDPTSTGGWICERAQEPTPFAAGPSAQSFPGWLVQNSATAPKAQKPKSARWWLWGVWGIIIQYHYRDKFITTSLRRHSKTDR